MIDRREFLKASMGVGLDMPDAATSAMQTQPSPSASAEIQSPFFRASFDTGSGRLSAWRKDGTPFLVNAVSRVLTPSGVHSTADPNYVRTVQQVKKVSDALGSGSALVIQCTDQRSQVDVLLHITVYDRRDALVVETICRNASPKDSLVIHTIEPVRAMRNDELGACYWPDATRILTNGYMYNDPGNVSDFRNMRYYPTAGCWNVALYSGEQEPGLVIGYLENKEAEGRISVWLEDGTRGKTVALDTESLYKPSVVVRPRNEHHVRPPDLHDWIGSLHHTRRLCPSHP